MSNLGLSFDRATENSQRRGRWLLVGGSIALLSGLVLLVGSVVSETLASITSSTPILSLVIGGAALLFARHLRAVAHYGADTGDDNSTARTAPRGDASDETELTIAPIQGVTVNAEPLRDADNRPQGALTIDVGGAQYAGQVLARQYRFTELLRIVATAANAAASVTEAAQVAVASVCATIDWPIGRFYLCPPPHTDTRTLSGEVWYAAPLPALAAFRRDTECIALNTDRGLIGRVLDTRELQWIEDLAAFPEWPRADAFRQTGLRSAMAAPIWVRDEIVGIIEFQSLRHEPRDPSIEETVLQVATQVGRVIERERAATALRASELRFRAVTESANDAIISIDEGGNIVYWNAAAARTFGYSFDEVSGASLERLMPTRYVAAYRHGLQQLRRGDANQTLGRTFSLHGLRRDGGEFPLELSISSWDIGDQHYFSGILRDVSTRVHHERELQTLAQELEQRVDQRTGQLRATNRDLAFEIDHRMRAEQEIRRYAQQQAAIAELGYQALVQLDTENIEALESRALQLLNQALAVDAAGIWIGAGTHPVLRAQSGLPLGTASAFAAAAMAQAAPIAVAALADDARFNAGPLAQVLPGGAAAVPILGQAKTFGVLTVHMRRPKALSDDELKFLGATANVLATAALRHEVERERQELLRHERNARAEAELAQQHLIGVLESTSDAFFAVDGQWRFTYVNRLAEQAFERAREELLGRDLWIEFPYIQATRFDTELRRVKRDRATVVFEERDPRSRGWFEVHAYPGHDGISVYFRDITDSKHNRDALHQSEERQRLLVEGVKDYAIYGLDLNGIVVSWNAGAQRITGYRPEEAVGARFDCFYPEAARVAGAPAAELASAYRDGRFETEDWRTRKDGTHFWANVIVTRLDDNNGTAVGYSQITRDLTERWQAAERLAAEKERLSVTLYSIADGVITADTAGRVVSINKAAERLSGWREAEGVGRSLRDVFRLLDNRRREVSIDPVDAILRAGNALEFAGDSTLIASSGEERAIAASGAPIHDRTGATIGVVLVFRDVSDKQRMELELLKAKNLESIGLLAGGIAHDFNNILTAILGNIALAKLYTDANTPLFESLAEAENACARARDLTQQLLTFSKGGAPIKKAASVAELLYQTTTFLLRGSRVRCAFDIASDLWPVSLDTGQISQVLNNLVLNAKQAMAHGGLIKISAANVQRGAGELGERNYVRITVEDQGSGIAPENLARIFDPYFTTKASGSGLGLATSYSIVKRHDGFIDVQSDVGVGTRFDIYLPALRDVTIESATRDVGELVSGHGRVLLMDDEEAILEVGASLMRRLGYDVDVAHDGAEAVKKYRAALAQNNPYHAVLMDLTIPAGMGGRECIEQLLKLDPHVKAIVSSGYSNDPVMADFRHYGFSGVIEKPYQLDKLSRAIAHVVAESRAHKPAHIAD